MINLQSLFNATRLHYSRKTASNRSTATTKLLTNLHKRAISYHLHPIRRTIFKNNFYFHNYKQHLLQQKRYTSNGINMQSSNVVFSEFGAPLKVLSTTQETIKFEPNSREHCNKILVKTRAAPVHPSDINVIQGVYGRLPFQFPAVPGNEALFEIVSTGSEVDTKNGGIGELAIAYRSGLGTWREYLIVNPTDIIPLRINSSALNKSSLIYELSQITVNACAAYRMIHDFITFNNENSGSNSNYIIQNAANSAVGECVIQLCKKLGINTINLIRGSEKGTVERSKHDFIALKEHLLNIGANIVLGDKDFEQLSSKQKNELLESYGITEENGNKPKLALNSVGGRVVTDMMKIMGESGVVVTYGGMSRKPVTIGTAPFIFQDISLRGFWMTRFKEESERDEELGKEYIRMINYLKGMVMNGELKISHKLVNYAHGEGLQYAIKSAMNAKEVTTQESVRFDIADEESEDSEKKPNKPAKPVTKRSNHANRGKVILVFDRD